MKKTLVILCGGQSAEHEISFTSAKHILDAVDKNQWQVRIVAISRSGILACISEEAFRQADRFDEATWNDHMAGMRSSPQGTLLQTRQNGILQDEIIHMVFPILHGPMGEDGTVQGWLDILNVPYVGSPVLASALCMDKGMSKTLLQRHGIPVVPFCTLREEESIPSYEELCQRLGATHLFVKPNALGSSVGVKKIKSKETCAHDIQQAFRYGDTVMVEKALHARELECAVLGNLQPKASGIAEIVPSHEFYSYTAKYLDSEGARVDIPADVSPEVVKTIQNLSLKAFTLLGCRGLARIDFFMTQNGEIYLNELNTSPGFTSISCYPKLWHAEGMSSEILIKTLIHLGKEQFKSVKSRHLEHDVNEDQKYCSSKTILAME